MSKILLLFLSVSLWANIGNIMAIKGSAEVKRESKMLKATNGMFLVQGDEIVTKKHTRVQVMLDDSTVVTIGANSNFSFEEFSMDGKNSKINMKAKRGFFRSVTGKIGKLAPERFKIKTVSATIGIRGTDFSGDIAPEAETIKCYSGAIFVDFEGATQEVGAGMMLELSPGKVEVKQIKTETKKSAKSTASKKSTKSKKESKSSSTKTSSTKSNTQKSTQSPEPQKVKTTEAPSSSFSAPVLEEIVELEVESIEIPTQDLAEVTQNAVNDIIVEELIEEVPTEGPIIVDPVVEIPVEQPIVELPVEQPIEQPIVELPIEEPIVELPVEEPIVELPVEEPVVVVPPSLDSPVVGELDRPTPY